MLKDKTFKKFQLKIDQKKIFQTCDHVIYNKRVTS
jgi:hypothetical protein